jgi:cytochrome c553
MLVHRHRPWLLTLLLVAGACQLGTARAGSTEVPDTLEQRIAPCTVCHGKQGEGVEKTGYYFPRIGGKPAGYLYRQLVNFREKRRQYVEMNYIVAYLPDAYLREIAEYFANQRPALPEPTVPKGSKQGLLRAESLITKGDASKGVPACMACHGKALTGTEPGIPGLVGLPAYYIAAQLGSWRNGVRHANEPDCMGKIASRLSADEGAWLGAWLASQRVSAAAAAAPPPARSAKLPLDCGDLK